MLTNIRPRADSGDGSNPKRGNDALGNPNVSKKMFAELTGWQQLDHLVEDGYCAEAKVWFAKAFTHINSRTWELWYEP